MHFLSFISLGGALLLLSSATLHAQEDWDPKIKEKYALLQDYCSGNEFQNAYPVFQWLLHEQPRLHENLYILGIKSIKGKYESSNNEAERKALIHELSRVYDLRIQHYGDSAKLSLRKAFDLYAAGMDAEDVLMLTLAAFDTAFNLNAGKVSSQFLVGYMDTAGKNYNKMLLSEDGVITRYLAIKDAFSSPSVGNNDEVSRHQSICDQLFFSLLQMDCNTIERKFAVDFYKNRNVELARVIVKLCITYKCTGESYFEEALNVYYASSPSYSIATFLGNKMREKGNKDLSERYYKDMAALSENKEQEAKAYLLLASLYFNVDKAMSRMYLNKTLALQPGMKEAYKMWGDLYFYSFDDCKKEVSHVEDRSVYLAAFEKYKLAGDDAKMRQASSQFPSSDNIHMENYRIGQEIDCGCWIKEKVTVRKRPLE